MSIVQAYREGLRRVKRFPAIPLWIFMMNFLIALPLVMTMRGILETSIGASAVHENLRTGFDLDWYGEFQSQSSGLATSFSPNIIGSFVLLENLDALLDGSLWSKYIGILAAGASFMLAWIFFTGGTLTAYLKPEVRYTRDKFFSANAKFFFRFVRLTLVSLMLYYLVYRYLGGWVLRSAPRAFVDATTEKTILLWTLLTYVLIAALMAFISMSFDYARILTVAEDRHSMILASWRGFQFALKNWPKTFGLYVFFSLMLLAWMSVYAIIAPGAGQAHWFTVSLAFAAGQLYVFIRIILKLLFLSGQSSLMQSLRLVSQPSATAQPAPVPPRPAPADAGLTQIS